MSESINSLRQFEDYDGDAEEVPDCCACQYYVYLESTDEHDCGFDGSGCAYGKDK
jgi:hypothetical protein